MSQESQEEREPRIPPDMRSDASEKTTTTSTDTSAATAGSPNTSPNASSSTASEPSSDLSSGKWPHEGMTDAERKRQSKQQGQNTTEKSVGDSTAEEFVDDAASDMRTTAKSVFGLLGEVEVDDLSGESSFIKFKHFLTGKDDATIFNVSFMSRPAEWHATAVGFFVAIGFASMLLGGVGAEVLVGNFADLLSNEAGGVAVLSTIVYFLGRTLKRMGDGNLHVKDALNEPAYAVLGWILGSVVRYAFLGAQMSGALPA